MKLAIATISTLIAFAPTKIDPLSILKVHERSHVITDQVNETIHVLADAQSVPMEVASEMAGV